MAKTILNIDAREHILDELRQHLKVPETGGTAALTVVLGGLEFEVNLRVTKVHTGAELAGLRAQLDAILAAEPWRIGERGQCGKSTNRKTSAWSSRNANCSKPITGAVLYKSYEFDYAAKKSIDKVSVSFYCPHHEHQHGIESFKIVGVLSLSKADVARYRKQLDEHNAKSAERRRIEQLTGAVSR